MSSNATSGNAMRGLAQQPSSKVRLSVKGSTFSEQSESEWSRRRPTGVDGAASDFEFRCYFSPSDSHVEIPYAAELEPLRHQSLKH